MISEFHHSSCQLATFVCSWTLKDFSGLSANPGCEYKSQAFYTDKGLSFCLCLYPGGVAGTPGGDTLVSCFVRNAHVQRNRAPASFKYHVELRDSNERTICRTSVDELVDPAIRSDADNGMMGRDALISELKDDVLVIHAHGCYSATGVALPYDASEKVRDASPVLALSRDLTSLWRYERDADVVVSVAGTDIPVHSWVLKARSKVFGAMLGSGPAGSGGDGPARLVITDSDPEVIARLLCFMYSGCLERVDASIASDLACAADKYDMSDLKQCCGSYLEPCDGSLF